MERRTGDLGGPGAGEVLTPEETAKAEKLSERMAKLAEIGVLAQTAGAALRDLAGEMRAVCERRRDWDYHASKFVD